MSNVEDEALAGAWRALCVSVLLQGVQRMEATSKLFKPGSRWKVTGNGGIDKELLHQRTQARDWIDGGIGTITFEDCCEVMDLDPDRTREKILDFCHNNRRKPMRSISFRANVANDPDELA